MTKSDLITAAFADSHRENYNTIAGLPDRIVQEAESLILARLDSYYLEYTLSDSDRGNVFTTGVYNLPPRVTRIRSITEKTAGSVPLDRSDETNVAYYSTNSRARLFVPRPSTVVIAGVPAQTLTFFMQYFGLPAPLVGPDDTNALLTDYSVLYKDAMLVSIFKRAKDYESAQIAFDSANGLIDTINAKMKKSLGGLQSSNPYNVGFRSSY